MVMATTQAAHVGDGVLAKMLAAAKEVEGLAATASNLEKAQLANWLEKHKTVEDVFKLLKLGDEAGKLFSSPVFSTWISYAETLSQSSEESMASMVRVLRLHRKDETLMNLVAAGKTSSPPFDVKNLSGNLEKMLMEKWMSSVQSEARVFELMGLKSTPVGDLLESPMFSMCVGQLQRSGPRYGTRFGKIGQQFLASAELRPLSAVAPVCRMETWGPDRIKFMASFRLSEPKLEQVLGDYTTFYKITTIMTRR